MAPGGGATHTPSEPHSQRLRGSTCACNVIEAQCGVAHPGVRSLGVWRPILRPRAARPTRCARGDPRLWLRCATLTRHFHNHICIVVASCIGWLGIVYWVVRMHTRGICMAKTAEKNTTLRGTRDAMFSTTDSGVYKQKFVSQTKFLRDGAGKRCATSASDTRDILTTRGRQGHQNAMSHVHATRAIQLTKRTPTTTLVYTEVWYELDAGPEVPTGTERVRTDTPGVHTDQLFDLPLREPDLQTEASEWVRGPQVLQIPRAVRQMFQTP